MNLDITQCSANFAVCPLTVHCKRAVWRVITPMPVTHMSFADFSEELIRKDNKVECPFFMGRKG